MTKRPHLSAVLLVVMVDLIGFGILLPLLPFYAATFGGGAFQAGLLFCIYSFAQFFFSPLWGQLSDRIGRRPVMMFSTAGASVAYLLFAVSDSFGMLFFSRLLAGVMGGNISAAQSYVSDVTAPDQRARGMGMIGAAFGIGFVLGPLISVISLHWLSSNEVNHWLGSGSFSFLLEVPYRLPAVIASLLSLTSFILVSLWLPESHRAGSTLKPWRWMPPLLRAFHGNLTGDLTPQSTPISRHLSAAGLISLAQSSLYAAFPLYCQSQYQMSVHEVGLLYTHGSFGRCDSRRSDSGSSKVMA